MECVWISVDIVAVKRMPLSKGSYTLQLQLYSVVLVLIQATTFLIVFGGFRAVSRENDLTRTNVSGLDYNDDKQNAVFWKNAE